MLRRPDILAKFRGPGWCHVCGKFCSFRDACHVFSKGGGRVDAPFNLYSAGSFVQFVCVCHREEREHGPNWRQRLLTIVAEREKTTPEAIELAVYFCRWLPKHPTQAALEWRLEQLSADARKLVLPYLPGARHD